MKKLFLFCVLLISNYAYALSTIQVTVYNELSDTLSIHSDPTYTSNWSATLVWDDSLKSSWVTRNTYLTPSDCEQIPKEELHAATSVKFSANGNVIGELQLKNVMGCNENSIEHLAQIIPNSSLCQISSQQIIEGMLDVTVHCKK